MYRIVGRDNLEAVEQVANMSLRVMQELQANEEDLIKVNANVLESITSGYLFLYEAVLQAGLMPNSKSAKHNHFITLH